MNFQDIEFWSFDRKTAAKIVGLSDSQLGNWLNRHGLYSDRRRGTGHAHSFIFKDLMQIAAIRALVEAGVEVSKAIDAVEPYSSPVVLLYRNEKRHRMYPGTASYIQNHEGQWHSGDSPKSKVCIEVRMWPVFDDLYPRFKQAILDEPWRGTKDQVEQGLEVFEKAMEEKRTLAWKA